MTATYVCERAPSLKLRLGNTRLQFKNKQLILDKLNLISQMDDALIKSAHLQSMIKKVDIEAAEKIALAHLAERRAAGAKGPFTSEDLKSQALDKRDAQLAQSQQLAAAGDMAAMQAAQKETIEQDLMLSHRADSIENVSVAESREGFIPDEAPEAPTVAKATDPQPSIESAATKQTALHTLLKK